MSSPPVRRPPLAAALLLALGCGPGNPAAPDAAPPSAERDAALAGARAALAAGELGEAERLLAECAASHGEDASLWTLGSELARRGGDVERALALAERAVGAAPQSSDAHLQRSRALAEKMRRAGMLGAMRSIGAWKSALARARELDPTGVEARSDEIAFHLIAPGIVGGSKERGVALARELVELDPEHGLPLLVWALASDERVDEALRTARGALAERPELRKLRVAYARLVEEERPAEAVAQLEPLLEGPRDDAYWEALYALARRLVLDERDLERAIALLEEYALHAPQGGALPPRAGACWRIGQAHEQLGRADLARASYRKALALDPGFEEAEEALDLLGE